MRSSRLALWTRVHHEAAHAVVGTLLGGRVTGVEVWPGPPVGGRTTVDGLGGASAGMSAIFGLVRRGDGPVEHAPRSPIVRGRRRVRRDEKHEAALERRP